MEKFLEEFEVIKLKIIHQLLFIISVQWRENGIESLPHTQVFKSLYVQPN